jgi:hypothetical protein
MKDIVNIEVVDQSIIITAQRSPRQGWFESPIADESVLNSIPSDEDTEEWVWE